MTFLWPGMLLGLLLIPLGLALLRAGQRRRRQALVKAGSLGFLQGGSDRRGVGRRWIPTAFFLAGLSVLLLALARPQMVVRLPRVEGTVILAFDVSGSMAADDFQPTRMEAAKSAAQAFVGHLPPSVQVGVVAFSDNGFTVQPPTYDQDAIFAAIERLSPQRGTALGSGILAAITTIETDFRQDGPLQLSVRTPQPTATPTAVPPGFHQPAVIVLLTDGENNASPDPQAAAEAARRRGVRIFTIGVGSTGGTPLKVNGFSIFTRLDEGLLQQVAAATGGAYFNAQNEDDLRSIYENLDTQLVVKPEKMEVTALLAGFSLALLLAGGAFSLAWFGRLP